MSTGYDALAWFYDRYWGPQFHDAARPVLERLLYTALSPGDRVLDLCCGTGHLTAELVSRGYRVVGVDNSGEMLRRARLRAPQAVLLRADAAHYALAHQACAAAVSTFDSINHLLTMDRAEAAFRCTAFALRPGGILVFDINTEHAYLSEWGKSSAIVDDDAALFVRGRYAPQTGVGETSITMFRRDGTWQRADVRLAQRSFAVDAIAAALRRSGFGDIVAVNAAEGGMAGDIGVGRVFVRARRASPG
jgi:SAM-dependent methyltransferase